ncbi:hypothetical protein VNO77_38881 [Canavalia gladiata]|uniref:Uncharacterized protein n=1 Tax=Canavalia gladiata TaxID=3824 RepID=A0AAN9KBH6_CANGL
MQSIYLPRTAEYVNVAPSQRRAWRVGLAVTTTHWAECDDSQKAPLGLAAQSQTSMEAKASVAIRPTRCPLKPSLLHSSGTGIPSATRVDIRDPRKEMIGRLCGMQTSREGSTNTALARDRMRIVKVEENNDGGGRGEIHP